MRIIRELALIGLLLLGAAGASEAAARRGLPVEKMEIQGFRLGMTAEEVRARLKELGYKEGTVSTGLGKNKIYNRKIVTAVDAKRDTEYLMFNFTSRVPVDQNRPTELISMMYQIPATPENKESLRKAAIAKYGQPTVPNWGRWCEKPGSNNCLDQKQYVLTLGAGFLQLRDNAADDRVSEYENALEAVKPRL